MNILRASLIVGASLILLAFPISTFADSAECHADPPECDDGYVVQGECTEVPQGDDQATCKGRMICKEDLGLDSSGNQVYGAKQPGASYVKCAWSVVEGMAEPGDIAVFEF